MRIIGGSLRGRRFDAVEGLTTRPTPDRVRESLFGILQAHITAQTRVLDCFAGSGALGFEAVSRGAESVFFCESDRQAYAQLMRNIEHLGLGKQAQTQQGDFLTLAPRISGGAFDLVFLDPPYAAQLYEPAFDALQQYNLLADNAIVVAEHDRAIALSGQYLAFFRFDRRVYGRTGLSFYKRQV